MSVDQGKADDLQMHVESLTPRNGSKLSTHSSQHRSVKLPSQINTSRDLQYLVQELKVNSGRNDEQKSGKIRKKLELQRNTEIIMGSGIANNIDFKPIMEACSDEDLQNTQSGSRIQLKKVVNNEKQRNTEG